MADIFISYSRTDQAKVLPIAKMLEELGWSVFMDVRIKTGERWDQVIRDNLAAAKCVLVVWSPTSVGRRWVLEEANFGLDNDILLPIRIEGAMPPVGFTLVQAEDFSGWDGGVDDPAFKGCDRILILYL